jgi:hypothetical protein
MEVSALTGGRDPRREVDYGEPLEAAVYFNLGPFMVRDSLFCADVWSALTNRVWKGPRGEIVLCSFRAAGDIIAAILDEGTYLDWYCIGRPGYLSPKIEKIMAKAKWVSEPANIKNIEIANA